MIGIDTNILVRYAVRDHPEQTKKATAVLEAATEENPVFVCAITLAEFVWVLQRTYRYKKADICNVLEKLFSAKEIVFEQGVAAWQSLTVYRKNNIEFADLLIARINKLHGCKTTKTFDRKAGATDDFEAV